MLGTSEAMIHKPRLNQFHRVYPVKFALGHFVYFALTEHFLPEAKVCLECAIRESIAWQY